MLYYHIVIFALIFAIILSYVPCFRSSIVSTGNFNDDFFIVWGRNHVNTTRDGKTRSLSLDYDSGSAYDSYNKYLFGQFDMKIKLIQGYSAGTVLAYYLISNTSKVSNRDEIDLEFLGNVTGQPYILQTNIHSSGFHAREEKISFWFDPSVDFHTYSILWNVYHIVIMVDGRPIRVYKNHEDKGVSFPKYRPTVLKGSLWNGSDWATRGGKDKVDWSKAPFIASFSNYTIDACVWKGNFNSCTESSSTNWWNQPEFSTLNSQQRLLYRWVRKYHLLYDYCQDSERFHGDLPKECNLPKY